MSSTFLEDFRSLQKNLPALEKDQVNAFTKKRFTSLDKMLAQCLPVIHRTGFCLVQPVRVLEDKLIVYSELIHVDSNEKVESCFLIIPEKMEPQEFGTWISYGRRYTLASLLALGSEEPEWDRQRPEQEQEKAQGLSAAKYAQLLKKVGAVKPEEVPDFKAKQDKWLEENLSEIQYEQVSGLLKDIFTRQGEEA
jgi:hypothetical protein